MKKQLIFDMTTCGSTLKSLSKLLNIDDSEIVKYIVTRKGEYSVEEFLEVFDVDENVVADKELLLTSLHVTTNNDNCESIKELGITNLQKAVTLNTPLKRYLKEQGVEINVEKKEIFYKGKNYDISKEYNGINIGSKDEQLNWIIYKLYKDYQINAFFYDKNVLNYGGDIRRRPEFLKNLAAFLKSSNIENNWKMSSEYQCHVIKFFAPISQFTNYTFNVEDMYYLEEQEFYLEKIKWVIKQSLRHLHDDKFNDGAENCYAYLRFDETIPYSNIISILTDVEYLKSIN
ncbi:hypothetical protein MKY04_18030 [Lysinibacillus telephonicus]|uniref:hypothetical protein n=1 Tax=Lysinibacillus telephonicus TaxID=1714840 RepID=UPI0031FD1429